LDTIKITPHRFAEGLTIPEYIGSMEQNRDTMQERYSSFELSKEFKDFLRNLGRPLNVLVLTEDWCNDSVRYLPVLFRMAEAVGNWDVHVLPRNTNLDLADVWLKDDKHRAIPVIVFFDEGMYERDYFIEKPEKVRSLEREARAQFAADHPHLPDAALLPIEMSDDTRAIYADFIREVRTRNLSLYQQWFVEEIGAKLQGIGTAMHPRG